MAKHGAAKVVHNALPGELHQVNLSKPDDHLAEQHRDKQHDQTGQTGERTRDPPGCRRQVAVDCKTDQVKQ